MKIVTIFFVGAFCDFTPPVGWAYAKLDRMGNYNVPYETTRLVIIIT